VLAAKRAACIVGSGWNVTMILPERSVATRAVEGTPAHSAVGVCLSGLHGAHRRHGRRKTPVVSWIGATASARRAALPLRRSNAPRPSW